MRSGRAAGSFGAGRLILGTDFPHENGTIFERTVTYTKTTAFAPATPTRLWDALDGQPDCPQATAARNR